MTTFGLVILVLALLALRQNLLVVLGVVLVYVYWAVGEDALSFILLDGWHALNKEVLLSIPLSVHVPVSVNEGCTNRLALRRQRVRSVACQVMPPE